MVLAELVRAAPTDAVAENVCWLLIPLAETLGPLVSQFVLPVVPAPGSLLVVGLFE